MYKSLLVSLVMAASGNPLFLNDRAYTKEVHDQMAKSIAAEDRGAIKEIVLGKFTTSQDKDYFEKISISAPPLKFQTTVSQKRNEIQLFNDFSNISLSNFDRQKESFQINGHAFTFEAGRSLEYHAQKVVEILNKKKAASGFWWLNAAEAKGDQGIWQAILAVIPNAVSEINVFSVSNSLDDILNLCKKRDMSFEHRLRFLETKRFFTLEEQRRITDCNVWARQHPEVDRLDTPEKLVKLCELGSKLVKCVDQSQAKPQKPPGEKGAT